MENLATKRPKFNTVLCPFSLKQIIQCHDSFFVSKLPFGEISTLARTFKRLKYVRQTLLLNLTSKLTFFLGGIHERLNDRNEHFLCKIFQPLHVAFERGLFKWRTVSLNICFVFCVSKLFVMIAVVTLFVNQK